VFQREQYWSQRPSVTDQADHEAFDSQGAVDHDGRIVWVLSKTKDTGVELFLQWNGMLEKAIDSGTFCLRGCEKIKNLTNQWRANGPPFS